MTSGEHFPRGPIRVKEASFADYGAAAAIHHRVMTDDGYGGSERALTADEVAEHWAAHGKLFVACFSNGEIVGSVTLVRPPSRFVQLASTDEAEVRFLAVLRDARRVGVARSLMNAAIGSARDGGAVAVVLSTQPSMIAAQRLYESMGFRRTPEKDRTDSGLRFLAYRFDCHGEVSP